MGGFADAFNTLPATFPGRSFISGELRPGGHLLQHVRTDHAGGLENGERDIGISLGSRDGAQDLRCRGIHGALVILALHAIVQDGAHALLRQPMGRHQ